MEDDEAPSGGRKRPREGGDESTSTSKSARPDVEEVVDDSDDEEGVEEIEDEEPEDE